MPAPSQTVLIFILVWSAMLATSFWEAYVEGRNPWDRRKLGWKLKLPSGYCLPAYHFFLFFVTFPLLLSLPLIISGWNPRLFGVLLSAYLSGIVLEDFGWFLVNPEVKLSDFNPVFASYYPWIVWGKLTIPVGYPILIALSLLSWWVFWK